MKKRTIKRLGVFDSGIGGLSILQELIKLPIAEFIYFADTANLPYGQKSFDLIKQLTLQAVHYLIDADVDGIIIACHTASAIALDFIQEQFPDLLILGVVDPVVHNALQKTKTNRLGIIGTPATIASDIHTKKILQYAPDAYVHGIACPKLVPLIEQAVKETQVLDQALQEYITPLRNAAIDTLIIGCTHYELIKDSIASVAGPTITLISSPQGITEHLRTHILALDSTVSPTVLYHVTGNHKQFIAHAHTAGLTVIYDCLSRRRNSSSSTPLTNL